MTNTTTTALKLTQDWESPGTSDKFESLIVEVEYALLDAPNVEFFHFISGRFVERAIGVTVELNDGKRTFYTVYDEDASMIFEADGSLVIAPCKSELSFCRGFLQSAQYSMLKLLHIL